MNEPTDDPMSKQQPQEGKGASQETDQSEARQGKASRQADDDERSSAPAKRRRPRRRPKSPQPTKAKKIARQRSAKAGSDAAPAPPADEWDISQFPVEPVDGKTRFHDLDLPPAIMHAIAELGFRYCTPIQAETLPQALTGVDVSGKAQTGTGKSAAFLITILARLLRTAPDGERQPGRPRALILAPTRELVVQIEKDGLDLGHHTSLSIVPCFGGMGYDQQRRRLAEQPVDILIATPGRLLDFMRQRIVKLNEVEIVVIDEADRMLDMGFIPDVRQIVHSTPPKDKRQTMFFSATLTPDVTRLAEQWTRKPIYVEIEPEQVAVDTVEQLVYMITSDQKFPLLYNLITKNELERVMVFCNRRDETRKLYEKLSRYGISCAMLSGDVAQIKRMKTLERFREGKVKVLVATDVAGRGIHIEGVSHVVNYHLPLDPEDYVHRIGRTGRAGASGISVSFADEEEAFYVTDIEEYLGRKFSCVFPEEELLAPLPQPKKQPREAKGGPSRPAKGRGRRPSGRSRSRRPRQSGRGRKSGSD